MGSYTSNLNLLKKDPTTDGNDTFNIKTMLNDNWDKIDDYAAKRKKTVVYIEESQNWTVPTGVYEVNVFLIGGGSGGWGAFFDGDGMYGSGKGGNGGYPAVGTIKVVPGAVIPVAVGAGGTGGQGRPTKSGAINTPAAGGTTSFGAILFAAGGNKDTGGSVGGASNYFSYSKGTSANGLAGGDYDSLKDGDTTSRTSFCDITNELYGGAGGSGCWIKTASLTATGGTGGAGGGIGGSSESLNGQNASKYGAGGGGGGVRYSSAAYGNGGNGHAGVCIIAY